MTHLPIRYGQCLFSDGSIHFYAPCFRDSFIYERYNFHFKIFSTFENIYEFLNKIIL